MKKLLFVIALGAISSLTAMEQKKVVTAGQWLAKYDTRLIITKIARTLDTKYTQITLPDRENSGAGIASYTIVLNDIHTTTIMYRLFHGLPTTKYDEYSLEEAKKISGRLAGVNNLLADHIMQQRMTKVDGSNRWHIVTTFAENNNLNPTSIEALFDHHLSDQ